MSIRILTILAITNFLFSWTVAAQGVACPVKCPEGNLDVQYLVETDSSVVLLCRFVPDAAADGSEPYLRNIDRKTHISTPDGDYALMHVCHIPVRDEADVKYAYLKGAQPSLNFALEFEKFTFDEPFDLVEDGSGSSSFSVSGLTVDGQKVDGIDTETFLAATPYSEYGYYYEDGFPVHYFDDGGINIVSTARPYANVKWNYLSVGFRIINNTGKNLDVKFKDLSADAQRLSKKKVPVRCNLRICDAEDANKEWQDVDAIEVSNEVNTTALDIASTVLHGTASHVVGGLLGDALGILGSLAEGAIYDAANEPYMEERNQIREEQMKQYFNDTSIQPGDTLSNFVTIKYMDKPSSTTVSITLNGNEYTMKY